ncbi:TPA: hypothetical protein ACSP71_000513 [Aeromonas hydrophila]
MKKKPAYMLWTGTIVCKTTGKKLWIAEGCHYDKANPGAREWLNPTFNPDEYEFPKPEQPRETWSPYAEGE